MSEAVQQPFWKNNLFQRLFVAAVLLPPVLVSFFWGGWWFRSVCFAAAALCLHEYGAIVAKEDKPGRTWFLLVGTVVTMLGAFIANATTLLLLVQFSFIAFAMRAVFVPGAIPTAWNRVALYCAGVAYVAFGFWSMLRVRELGDAFTNSAKGSFVLLGFTATWANDSSAYFAGRAFGKHKMATQISPKKTWEGFVGGIFGTLAFLFGFKALFADTFASMTWVDLVLVGIPASILGPVGDLVESLLKRSFDVKDSGTLLPGHGGILDRLDAVFFVMPWVLAYFTVLKPYLVAHGVVP